MVEWKCKDWHMHVHIHIPTYIPTYMDMCLVDVAISDQFLSLQNGQALERTWIEVSLFSGMQSTFQFNFNSHNWKWKPYKKENTIHLCVKSEWNNLSTFDVIPGHIYTWKRTYPIYKLINSDSISWPDCSQL
jgi:hypothetical protein